MRFVGDGWIDEQRPVVGASAITSAAHVIIVATRCGCVCDREMDTISVESSGCAVTSVAVAIVYVDQSITASAPIIICLHGGVVMYNDNSSKDAGHCCVR